MNFKPIEPITKKRLRKSKRFFVPITRKHITNTLSAKPQPTEKIKKERNIITMSVSNFSMFMRANKKQKENGRYAATRSLCDEKGAPLEWEFTHITSKQNDIIREECVTEIPVQGKPNLYRPKLKTALYLQKLIAASVVYPDLYDAELQDSYGVKTPEELVYAMVDDPGEYSELAAFVQRFQGFDTSLEEKAEKAKN